MQKLCTSTLSEGRQAGLLYIMQFRSSDRKDKPHKNILFCLVKNKIFMAFLVSEIADSIIFGSVRGRPTCNADISVVLYVVRT